MVIIVVLVFVSPLYELLLCLLKSKWPYESLAIRRDIDVCHVAWVIDSWLPLERAQLLVLPSVGRRCHLRRGMVLAFVDTRSLPMALHLLARVVAV